MAMKVALGTDFGGSKIAFSVCDPDGQCIVQQVVPTDPEGSAARPWRERTLEHTVSGVGHAVGGMGAAGIGSRLLSRAVTAGQVFGAAQADPGADVIVSNMIGELGPRLANLVIAADLAPARSAAGRVRSWDRLQTPPEQAPKSSVPHRPELLLASYSFNAPPVGALALAAEAAGASLAQGLSLSATQPERGKTI
ncbi:MAG: hypothetical protein ACRDZX_12370 [Acidimicrobiales bacterium]